MKIEISVQQFDRMLNKSLLESKNGFRELTEEEEDKAFAAFVVAKLPNGKIAATTRPYEKKENKQLGLPGGKVEKNETPIDAARRESKEEGWDVKVGKIIASEKKNNEPIVYFEGKNPVKLKNYKEKENGIEPIEVSIDEISSTGYKNDFIKELYGSETEIKEQDAAPTSGTSSSGSKEGYPEVGKWESGVTRGPSNQIAVTKWSDIVGSTLKRGKANPLK